MHKSRPLLKFMNLVATDGYIIDCFGPYVADGMNNDANILMDTFEKKVFDLENNFQSDDIFVVDRGFRDCLRYLEENDIDFHMQPYLGGKEQYATASANYSRLISKVIVVIAVVNFQAYYQKIYFRLDGSLSQHTPESKNGNTLPIQSATKRFLHLEWIIRYFAQS